MKDLGLVSKLRAAIKERRPLTDSAFWYLNDEGVDALFELEQSEEYKRTFISSTTQDMQAIAEYIAKEHSGKSKIVFTDWGCGNGQISRIITQDLICRNFDVTYMPISISEKELSVAVKEHTGEKTEPLLCLFENLRNIFPLKVKDNTVVVHGFLGGTVSNFEKSKINEIIKSVGEEVIVHMPITPVSSRQDILDLISGYQNSSMEKIVMGPLKLCGFTNEDFVLHETGFRHKVRFEDGVIKTSVVLSKDKVFDGARLKAGTEYDVSQSRKYSFEQFKEFVAPSCSEVQMLGEKAAMAICKAREHLPASQE